MGEREHMQRRGIRQLGHSKRHSVDTSLSVHPALSTLPATQPLGMPDSRLQAPSPHAHLPSCGDPQHAASQPYATLPDPATMRGSSAALPGPLPPTSPACLRRVAPPLHPRHHRGQDHQAQRQEQLRAAAQPVPLYPPAPAGGGGKGGGGVERYSAHWPALRSQHTLPATLPAQQKGVGCGGPPPSATLRLPAHFPRPAVHPCIVPPWHPALYRPAPHLRLASGGSSQGTSAPRSTSHLAASKV